MDYIKHYLSPLGKITLASDGTSLMGLWFENQSHFAEGLSANPQEAPLTVFDEAVRWLDAYFGGAVPDFMPPVRLEGTAFRKRVWEALMTIPYGQTVTYGALAASLGLKPGAARAVGGALARNPISLIVPCHRVVGSGGGLTGYAGGLERKRRLLALETR